MGVNKSNFIVRSVRPASVFPSLLHLVDNTISFEQGDLLFYDAANDLVKVLGAETDTAAFLGISEVTLVLGKIKQPYSTDVDASQAIVSEAGPVFGVVALLEAKSGDSFTPGVEVGADAANLKRGASTTITTNSIGVYQGKALTASAGDLIEVLLTAQYPFASM